MNLEIKVRRHAASAVHRPAFLAFSLLTACWLVPRSATACSQWAERVETWDAKADAVVIAVWLERDRPPSGTVGFLRRSDKNRRGLRAHTTQPQQFELRRISDGMGLASYTCPTSGPGPAGATKDSCDWKAAFAKILPAPPVWGAVGPPLDSNRLRVNWQASRGGGREFVLKTRTARTWEPLLWLEVIARGYPERHIYKVGESEIRDRTLTLALQYHSRGGNCAHTAVRVFSIPEEDLRDPSRPGRYEHLLANVRMDRAFGHWRTVTMLGKVPPSRLIEALEIAEVAGEEEEGARWWWQATTSTLARSDYLALQRALTVNPGLYQTRAAIARRN